MPTLFDLGEERITRELILPRFPSVSADGFGADDCAVFPSVGGSEVFVHTTDPGPTPVVFDLFDPDYFHFGWMTVTVNASDIASMGAKPLQMLLSVEAPPEMPVSEFERLLDGVAAGAEAMDVTVAGGNLRDAERVRVTGTMIGAVSNGEPMRRGGGKKGDAIWAIGQTGYFWLSVLTCLRNGFDQGLTDPKVAETLLKPMAKTAFGKELQRLGFSRGATDASDGLMAAIESISYASGCAAVLEITDLQPDPWVARVASELGVDWRTCALAWGDWQIVTTIDPQNELALKELASRFGLHAMRCGVLVDGAAGNLECRLAGQLIQPPDLRSKKFSQAHKGWTYMDWAQMIEGFAFSPATL